MKAVHGRGVRHVTDQHSLVIIITLGRELRKQVRMHGQSMYGRGTNTNRSQNNYQSQRNYNQGTGMEEHQNSVPQQDDIPEQRAAQAAHNAPESQYSSPCQVFQPNPVKREKLLRTNCRLVDPVMAANRRIASPFLQHVEKFHLLFYVARKEEEDYDHFKQSMSLGRIDLPPSRLGGYISESEARQQQQRILSQSKYQKMIQREDQRRKQKEEEDAKIQEMKDIQRKKSEKLEENRQKQDLERKQKWLEDRQQRNEAFFDRFQPIDYTDEGPFGQLSKWAENEEEDDDWMYKKALEESIKTHKIEEEARLQEVKKHQHKQPKQQTHRQQQKEEEERILKEMKEKQHRKAELLKMHEEQRRLSQEKERMRVNKAFLDRFQNQNA
ncbi:epithelial-stromal interaction protein 1 isoform X4 [Phyllobates terribilis]|uniref:epithelial-stromal interaction protein 1 isoform X4 n=1 Tax=Phyllobates terribilis TaxID=111132 RepID=UPI003CCB71D9